MKNLKLPEGDVCHICKKHDNEPVALIPIAGTKIGTIYECKLIHVECITKTVKIYSDNIILGVFND